MVAGERALTRMQPMRTGRTALILLLAVTALAFALRLSGLDKLLPHIEEADPGLVVQEQLLRAHIAPDPVAHKPYFAYPTLLARCIAYLPPPTVAPSTPASELLPEHLAAASSDFVRMRTWIALLASMLVPLTWMLARRLLGSVGAISAAAFVALSLLHLLFSQQARPHGAHATVALAAVLAHLALLQRPSDARFAVAALACAAAIACLHTGIFTLTPLVVAWWLARRGGRRLPWWFNVAALPPCAAAALFFYPRAPLTEHEGATVELGGHTLYLDKIDGTGFRTVASVMWNYDPALFVLAAIGAVLAIAHWMRSRPLASERRDVALVMSAYALPYLLAIGLFGETVDRFLMPLVPYFALLAGFAVERALGALQRISAVRAPRVALQALALAAAFAFPGFAIARYVAVRDTPDTFERAAAWVTEHVEPAGGRVLLSPRMVLPLFHEQAALDFTQGDGTTRKKRAWISYQLEHFATPETSAALANSPRFGLFVAPTKLVNQKDQVARDTVEAVLAQVEPQYVMIERSKLMTILPGVQAMREEVAARGELVETIRGESADECEVPPIDYQEIPHFVTRLLRARCFGPCIEIYRMNER
jgi:hypothetical protein